MMKSAAVVIRVSIAKRSYSTVYGAFKVPHFTNEPNQLYEAGSESRKGIADAVEKLNQSLPVKIPLVIGGQKIYTDKIESQLNPANHNQSVAHVSIADENHVNKAIEASLKAKSLWSSKPLHERAAVFLKAADLISTKYRYHIMAATMLGQGKNIYQAEIDAAAELIDFFRLNVGYAHDLYSQQPDRISPYVWNRAEYRPLEGFIYAITPFNFTAIAGNLIGAPALMGNTVNWKPSSYAVLSNYILYQILEEAGLPSGVVNFIPGPAPEISQQLIDNENFGGLHYTGSTSVFKNLYKKIANNIDNYHSYPRIVGETGGKNFHLIHQSADIETAVNATIRGAFEYQGQKCSATSRVYIPESLWPKMKRLLIDRVEELSIGSPDDLVSFIGPVIHKDSFNKLNNVINEFKQNPDKYKILVGGKTDNTSGYYIKPTIVETGDLSSPILNDEYFGPILGVYIYKDNDYNKIIKSIDSTSKYALTGSIFAIDRNAIEIACNGLKNVAGNFYINDKSTGAVVGQQWFGGARLSGTNDKSGSANILSRFISIQNVKETFIPTTTVNYPSNYE